MKATIEDNELRIDLYHLAESLSPEDRRKFADAAAFCDDIIQYVVQQVLDGATDFGSYSGRAIPPRSEPTRGLDWACRQIALRAGEVAADEIRRLQEGIKMLERENDELRTRNAELQWRC